MGRGAWQATILGELKFMNGFGKDHTTERNRLIYTRLFQTCAGLCSVPGNELVVIFSLGFLAKANSELP